MAYAYQAEYDNVLPIWGIQRMSELEEFISYIDNPPVMDDEIKAVIENDKKELAGNFCRGCGYCVPTCPAHIEINNCARMSLLLRRSPSELQLTEVVQAKMKMIEDCINCGQCKHHCPSPDLIHLSFFVTTIRIIRKCLPANRCNVRYKNNKQSPKSQL